MRKPFQFSMGQLFWAMTCFCVAAWSVSLIARYGFGPQFQVSPGVATLAFISVGAGLGSLIKTPIAGAVCGFYVAAFLAFVCLAFIYLGVWM